MRAAVGLAIVAACACVHLGCSNASDPARTAAEPDGGGALDDEAGLVDEEGGGSVDDAGPPLHFEGSVGDQDGGVGHVLVLLPDGDWHRFVAAPGGIDENLGAELDSQSAGTDQYANVAMSNEWLVFQTSRFGCGDDGCVVRTAGDLTGAEVISAGGAVVTSEGRPAIDSSGTHVAFEASSGPHDWDLYVTTRGQGGWGIPVLLSGASTAAYNHDPFFSADGTRIAFNCGPDPSKGAGGQICQVNTDGTGFATVVTLADGPSEYSPSAENETYEPTYAPDGSLVFEGTWNMQTQQVWRSVGGVVSQAAPSYTNDVSPCALPNGRIVSLWLGRAGNTGGYHELKVMNADGSNEQMILTDVAIQDVGTGCSR